MPVTVGKKTTCKPLAKAIPRPKAIDIRLAHLQEALKLDPAKSLKGKKAKKARKKLLKALPKALAFIDRKGGARRSLLAGGLAHASAGCDVGPAGPTGQTGGASVGALGENGGYIDASAGGGIRVRVTFVTCKGATNFRIPQCPTANGSVDTTAKGEFRATVEVWDGDELVSRNSSTFEDRAKAHGEVGPDAKLKFIDVEHTQEVFIVASGGIVIRGGVTRTVRIAHARREIRPRQRKSQILRGQRLPENRSGRLRQHRRIRAQCLWRRRAALEHVQPQRRLLRRAGLHA